MKTAVLDDLDLDIDESDIEEEQEELQILSTQLSYYGAVMGENL